MNMQSDQQFAFNRVHFFVENSQIDEQWAINLWERLVNTKKRIQQEIKPGN